MQTSNIVVTGMESKPIKKRNGDMGRLFTIEANDGRKYVTWDEDFYHARRVGEELTLNYEVSTREWKGKTYSDYKIVTQTSPAPSSNPALPTQPSANEAKVIDALRKVYQRIEMMEKNIIDSNQKLGEFNIFLYDFFMLAYTRRQTGVYCSPSSLCHLLSSPFDHTCIYDNHTNLFSLLSLSFSLSALYSVAFPRNKACQKT